jgi:hypothetical protein
VQSAYLGPQNAFVFETSSCACRFGFPARGGSQQHGLPGIVQLATVSRAPDKQPGVPRPFTTMHGSQQIQLSQSQNTFSQLSQNDEQYQLMVVRSQDESRQQEEVRAYEIEKAMS